MPRDGSAWELRPHLRARCRFLRAARCRLSIQTPFAGWALLPFAPGDSPVKGDGTLKGCLSTPLLQNPGRACTAPQRMTTPLEGGARLPEDAGEGLRAPGLPFPGALSKVWGWAGVSPVEKRCSHNLAPTPVPLPQAADTSGPVPRWERSAQGCDGHIACHRLDRPPGLALATNGCVTSLLQPVSPSFWPPRDHLSSLVL